MARKRGRWIVVMAVVVLVVWWAGTRDEQRPGSGQQGGAASELSSPEDGSDEVARFAEPVVEHATAAGINPRLLMAVLYNESYKPHDPALQRAWQRIDPDAAFGIANMHEAAFNDTKQGRDFADRDWHELPDDPDLAVQAAAWHLHDLDAQLPAELPGDYSRDDLLAMGYNAGAGNMAEFARGVTPGSQAQSYVDRLHDNWDKAGAAIAERGSR
ncbi:Transglycosylase SLT domain-containing protein [Prauserella marina]|uniref:Transglycosylase SLT domain-containing protein n=1 Tax=Prauserella marina TaxID=530584 RepID=A0A1G6REX3_9PSEU|nr:transglycosylase SLT domain-containing protein [Prauserella marina]PWV77022.1 transglycosylase-like protein with SLT domain [Prauserella marina]SDD02577.1 Transglycosylase SLT domain-containing protein [Prauserella marina]